MLNIDVIKTFISQYGAPMPLAYIIKSARIPLATLNTRFPQWLVRDTFMMLNEIENAYNEPVAEISNSGEILTTNEKSANSKVEENISAENNKLDEEQSEQLSLINETEVAKKEKTSPKKTRGRKASQPKKSTGKRAGRPKKAKE